MGFVTWAGYVQTAEDYGGDMLGRDLCIGFPERRIRNN